MKFEKQLEAQKLRREGKAITYIAKELGVSKSSVSLWVKDIQLTDEQKQQLTSAKSYNFKDELGEKKKEAALNLRKTYQEEGKQQALTGNLLHCMGCMLFWAEGTKNKNTITFTNSDVNMMKLFIKFLHECLNVTNKQISVHINCYLPKKEDIEKVNNFWIEQLNIAGAKFIKPTIKITKQEILNNGVCRVTIHNTKLVQQIYGAIQAYVGFDNGLGLENKRTRTNSI